MGDFKRSSSRFSRGGGNSGGDGESRGGGGGYRGRSGGGRSGGYSRGGDGGGRRSEGRGGGGDKEFPFTRVGNLAYTKSVPDDVRAAFEDLLNQGLQFNIKIYLGKDNNNELVLKNGDYMLVDHKIGDKDKDFVVGHLSVKN